MQKREVAIIDIGSSKMSSFIGEAGVNKTFVIKGFKQVDYNGYFDGAFLDVKETVSVLSQMADNLKVSSSQVKKVYVGVPGGFTRNIVRESQISFPKKRKITDKEINMLYDSGLPENNAGINVINRSAILYELDDFRKTPAVFGEMSATLKGKVSYVLCSDAFTKIVRETLKKCGFNEVEFISVPLAESLYLIDAESRDRLAILIDVGYIATTLSIIQGDGILFQRSFDYGGGMITAGLTEKFNIDFDVAEKLKRKAIISVVSPDDDSYEIISGDNGLYFNKNKVKQVINNSLDELAEQINASLNASKINIPEYVALQITGGGISHIRGAKERLSNLLNTVVETVSPDLPFMDNPESSSYISVLNLALEQ